MLKIVGATNACDTMPKVSLAKITALAQDEKFFEGIRLTFGGYTAAGKSIKIDPKHLRASEEPSDAQLKRLQKAIGKMSRGNYEVATKYAKIRQTKVTGGQRDYMLKETRKGDTQRRYFRKAVREAYAKDYRHVRYGAIDSTTGKTFVISPSKKKVRRGSKGRRRHVRRHGR